MMTMTELPEEPPDGARVEFSNRGLLLAAYRDDAKAKEDYWPEGQSWFLYGETCPRSWRQLVPVFEQTEFIELEVVRRERDG